MSKYVLPDDRELEKSDIDDEFDSIFGGDFVEWYKDFDHCATEAEIKTRLEIIPIPIAVSIFKKLIEKKTGWTFLLTKGE